MKRNSFGMMRENVSLFDDSIAYGWVEPERGGGVTDSVTVIVEGGMVSSQLPLQHDPVGLTFSPW